MKKRVLTTLFLLLMVCVVTVNAVNLTNILRFYEFTDNDVLFYAKELPTGGKVTINIDGTVVANPGVSTVSKLERSTTVMCLVDTSTAFSNAMHTQVKDVLNIISSRMGEKDSMIIATLGEELIISDQLFGREAQKNAISRISPKGLTTDLFQSVVTCLTELETKTSFSANRVLLVLSDGHNDGHSSMTEDQMLDAIRSISIPVYSVSTIDPYPSDYLLKNAKNLTRMSQESVGGLNFIPSVEKMTAAQAADKIWTNIQDSTIFTAPIREIPSRATQATVQIHYETVENKYDQTFIADLTALDTKPGGYHPSVSTWETPMTTPTTPARSNTVIYVAVGGGVALLLIIGAVVILTMRKKKNVPVMDNNAQVTTFAQPSVENSMPTDMFRGNDRPADVFRGSTTPLNPQPVPQPAPQPKPQPKADAVAHFVALHHAGVAKDIPLTIHKAVSIGRDTRADVVLNASDKQLSGRHASLEWDGTKLYIRDEGSTNGSSLNGVPMKAGTWHWVIDDAKLHLGMYDYRVTIQKK